MNILELLKYGIWNWPSLIHVQSHNKILKMPCHWEVQSALYETRGMEHGQQARVYQAQDHHMAQILFIWTLLIVIALQLLIGMWQ